MFKLLTVFALNLLISVPTYALAVEQKDINFSVDTNLLMKGDVHYAQKILSPTKFHSKYADLYDLDSLAMLQEPNIKVVISKTAYIVDKPVGFFDHLNVEDEKFIKHIMGKQKVKKISGNHFKIKVEGSSGYTYKMSNFFDSDDISTLPNSKVVRAVTQAKKWDVISQSAATIFYKEMTNYTKYFNGGVQVSSHIPINENKTLILNYSLFSVKKQFAIKKILKRSLKDEAVAQKDLINRFK